MAQMSQNDPFELILLTAAALSHHHAFNSQLVPKNNRNYKLVYKKLDRKKKLLVGPKRRVWHRLGSLSSSFCPLHAIPMAAWHHLGQFLSLTRWWPWWEEGGVSVVVGLRRRQCHSGDSYGTNMCKQIFWNGWVQPLANWYAHFVAIREQIKKRIRENG